jgi:hypothetical protein
MAALGSAAEHLQAQLGAFCRSARSAAERDVADADGVVAELRQLLSAHARLEQQLGASAPGHEDAEDARGASRAVGDALQRFMHGLDGAASQLRGTLDACYQAIPESQGYSFEARDVVRLAHRIRNNASMMIRPPNGDGVVEPPMPPAPQKWDMQVSRLQRFNERQQQRLRGEAAAAAARQPHQPGAPQGPGQPDVDLSEMLKRVFSRGPGDAQFEQLGQIMNQLTAAGWTLQEFAKGNVPPLLAAFLRACHERDAAAAGGAAAGGAAAGGAAAGGAAAAGAPLARQPSAAAAAAAAAREQEEQQQAAERVRQDGFSQALQTSLLPSWMLDEDEDDEDY